jgi:hypothetical protein
MQVNKLEMSDKVRFENDSVVTPNGNKISNSKHSTIVNDGVN